MKRTLAGQQFHGITNPLDGIRVFLDKNQRFELEPVFRPEIKRIRWVSANDGEFFYEEAFVITLGSNSLLIGLWQVIIDPLIESHDSKFPLSQWATGSPR
jgi:hypothetical protein